MNRMPGRRLFVAAAIVYLLFGGTHLMAVYQGNFVPSTAPLQVEADRAMRALTFDIGPFHTNGYMLVQLLSASYSALLLFVGVMNLYPLRSPIDAARLRGLTIVNLIFTTLLLAITIIYQFPPPMLFALIIEILLIASLVRQRNQPLAA